MSKTGMVTINEELEAGEVVQENAKTALLKFEKLPGQPVLKFRKRKVRLILGDRWDVS